MASAAPGIIPGIISTYNYEPVNNNPETDIGINTTTSHDFNMCMWISYP